MAEEEQQQKAAAIQMPQINPYIVAQDDYAYEPKAKEEEPKPEGQQMQQGGMSSQFEIVSSALNKNI